MLRFNNMRDISINKRWFFLSVLLVLAGCSGMNRSPSSPTAFQSLGVVYAQPEERDVFEPPVGQQGVVAIGESITSHSKESKSKAIQINKRLMVEGVYDKHYTWRIFIPNGRYKISAHDNQKSEYFKIGSTKVDWFYEGKPSDTYTVDLYIKIQEDGRPQAVLTYPQEPGSEAYATDASSLQFEISEVIEPLSKPSFRRELIYTGRSGSSVFIMYREFINDMARPAFTQALQYDVAADPIIGYQGGRFRVIKADNTSIAYEVISHLPPR